MNSYEILIYNMADDTEMNTIQQALHDAGIEDGGDAEVGAYLQADKPRSVFVSGYYGNAVEVLNALGYKTDEDEGAQSP